MTSRTRLWILAISTPVIAFTLLGGFIGKLMANDDTLRQLKIFQDVVGLVNENYVEPVDMRQAMRGAMRGLADGLDPECAYLTPDLVKTYESNTSAGPADVGLDVTRAYYLRIISAAPGSPAAKAGIRSGDYIRAIDAKATREISSYEGMRLLRGQAGSRVKLLVIRGNAADPHEVTLTRDRTTLPEPSSRMADSATGYVRVLEFKSDTAARIKQAFDTLGKSGAGRYIVDLRGASAGDLDDGIAAARMFVKSGAKLSIKQSKDRSETISAQAADGAIIARVVLLVDQGTAGAAEVFAAALDGNDRTELIGEHTVGRAARQKLVKLPDGSGLLMTSQRYLTPRNADIHEKGLAPDIEVDGPDVDFGAEAPAKDLVLERALQHLASPAQKRAA
jgi:carboxyl-terminal processing protease